MPKQIATKTQHRTFARYACNQLGSCRGISAGPEDSWVATIRDVSQTGIGLADSRWFKVGTILVVQRLDSIPRPFLVRVGRVAAQADGYWSLGCELLC